MQFTVCDKDKLDSIIFVPSGIAQKSFWRCPLYRGDTVVSDVVLAAE